jgi:catalase
MPDNFFADTEQVAFCTQNVVPGIDFSDDPLLQGRNFSYLDTQLKRLGSPNFMHLPINAPRCPFAHFQQDGHMTFMNPKGRANYEPNSWGPEVGGPREDPARGYRFFAQETAGPKVVARSDTFADHYSQARQFYISQAPIEQKHLGDALVFELSKVERPDIRERMVSHLRNIDGGLAANVAKGLGIRLPPAMKPLRKPVELPPSDALSIVRNGPERFEGRKLGILVTDGASADLVQGVAEAVAAAGGMIEVIAPMIAGVALDDGTALPAQQKIDGGPSVLYDAVAIVVSEEGAALLLKDASTRDFISDAFAHAKFIGFSGEARPLLDRAGIGDALDDGCMEIDAGTVDDFISRLGEVRFWAREPGVDVDAD